MGYGIQHRFVSLGLHELDNSSAYQYAKFATLGSLLGKQRRQTDLLLFWKRDVFHDSSVNSVIVDFLTITIALQR